MTGFRSRNFIRCVNVVFIIVLLVIPMAIGEHIAWDCPGCGRTGNTGNYCGSCAHPAPWIESDKNDEGSADSSQFHRMKSYVAAGDLFTVAIEENGTCVSTGDAPNVSKWKNMVSICANRNNVAGIKSDGTVACTNASLKVSGWKNIVMLDYNSNVFEPDEHIVGLHKDGTVIATGTNSYGECDVSGWSHIVDISAGFTHTVGLRSDGTVVATGDNKYGQCDTIEWTDIVDVAAARYSTYGLKNNGQIVATGVIDTGYGDQKPTPAHNIDWKDVVAITADNETGAARDYVIAIKKDGSIVTNRTDLGAYITKDEVAAFSNVVSLDCASWGYIVCINSEGKATDIGWDVDGRRNISKWEKLKTKD